MDETRERSAPGGEDASRRGPPPKRKPWGLEDPDELIGTRIADRFTIVEKIARGGMGAVFKGVQAPMGRMCAVKVLSASYEGKKDPAFHRRFFREAAMVSRLCHPNTVTVYDYGHIGDLYYIAMEYVGGRTLHRAILEDGVFSEPRARRVAMQICRSLREAHQSGVVHRDIKPENILLVDQAAEHDLVKVVDFGLAKVVAGELADEEVTETGLCMGSPKYMAPEQIQGGTISAHTDIYGLGIVLYEMLAGFSPFDRPTRYQTLVAQVHEPPPPMNKFVPDLQVTPAFLDIIRRCLQKEPHRRYASMNHVLEALKETLRASHASLSSSPAIVSGPSPPSPPTAPSPSHAKLIESVYPPVVSSPSVAPELRSVDAIRPVSLPVHERIPPLPPFRVEPPPTGRTAAAIGISVGLGAVLLVGAAWSYVHYTRSSNADRQAAGATEPAPSSPPPSASVASSTSAPPRVISRTKIETEPAGARVEERGDVLCAMTPCVVTWKGANGSRHDLTLRKQGYGVMTVKADEGDDALRVKLVPLGRAGPGPGGDDESATDLEEDTGYKYSPY